MTVILNVSWTFVPVRSTVLSLRCIVFFVCFLLDRRITLIVVWRIFVKFRDSVHCGPMKSKLISTDPVRLVNVVDIVS